MRIRAKYPSKARIGETGEKGETGECGNPASSGLVSDLLARGIREGAEGILITPGAPNSLIFFIIDDFPHQAGEIPRYSYDEILLRLKMLSGAPPEKRLPIQAHFEMEFGEETKIFHTSFLPLPEGERIMIKFHPAPLPPGKHLIPGLDNLETEKLLKAARRKGIIIIGGPGGSGRSTTIERIINSIGKTFVLCLEDRPGKSSQATSRVRRDSLSSLSHISPGLDNFIPHVLAQGYKVLAVENVNLTTEIPALLQAAGAGMTVLASIYGDRVSEIVERMISHNADPVALAENLSAVLAQRRVRLLCKCEKKPGQKKKSSARPISGCNLCRGTGFKGTTGIFEAAFPSEEMRNSIRKKSDIHRILEETSSSTHSSFDNEGEKLLKAKLTTREELTRVIQMEVGS
jgi:type II secretory ATPase GspE/PulE/Tfp pilus assembly ATPase PilB-like protein